MSIEPSPIWTAIAKTALEVPDLTKTQRNTHGGYNFVSIDDFYRDVASIALANGLIWAIHETDYQFQPEAGKNGSVQARYSVDLHHVPSNNTLSNIFSATIMHPMAGAQGAGSSLSYVDKMFMKSQFKCRTGEPDADSTDNTPAAQVATFTRDIFAAPTAPTKFVTPPPKPEKVAPTEAEHDAEWVSTFSSMVAEALPLASKQSELTEYWTDNAQALDKLKAMSLSSYNDLITKFKARKAELLKEGK